MPVKKAAKAASKDQGKTTAIISYITLIGLIIALIQNSKLKSEFASFHIRQSLLLVIASVFGSIPIIGWIWAIFVFVLWIIGLIGAINGEKKEVPVLGKMAQDWFKSL